MTSTALVAAGGAGQRVGSPRSKVLLPLRGVPVLVWTLRALQQTDCIANIVLIVRPQDAEEMTRLAREHHLDKVPDFVPGGPERQDSVFNGLTRAQQLHEIVVIHDAARPLASPALIERVCAAAAEHGAALAAVPVVDTLNRADAELRVTDTVPREGLWRVQTPQAFRREVIVEAHRRARRDGFVATDDATLVRHYGGVVRIVPGESWNLKITEPADFHLAEALMSCREAENDGE